MHLKGVNKAQQKHNFIAKGVVPNNYKSNAAKTKKTPFKIHFLIRTKKSSSIFFFIFLRGGCLYICQNLDFRGVISIFARLKVLNRDIDFAAKTKNKTLKRRFWTKNIKPKVTGILRT